MTSTRNYDQSTGIHSQVYTHDFPGGGDPTPTKGTVRMPPSVSAERAETEGGILTVPLVGVGSPPPGKS